jgi:hypothetical protein
MTGGLMDEEQLAERELARKIEALGEKLPLCQFVCINPK